MNESPDKGEVNIMEIGEITDEDKDMVTKVFKRFDADGTGAVSTSELGNIMRSIGWFR